MGRSNELDLSKYNTDKVANQYLSEYDDELSHIGRDAKMFELGVKDGGSLLLWRDYFPQGAVTGLDWNLSNLKYDPATYDRLKVYEGSQADQGLLDRIAAERAPEGFDVIVDDASHVGSLSRESYEHLFDKHLKPGGVYVVEDWTTGYWSNWSDGKAYKPRGALMATIYSAAAKVGLCKSIPSDNHPYGLVGFIKELVDEQGASDLLRGADGATRGRKSRFRKTVFYRSTVFLHKAAVPKG